jgi:hypothetical protein
VIEVFVERRFHFTDTALSFSEDGHLILAQATSTNVGIGTTTPDYKLTVGGDVGAEGFVNLSTRDAKKEIEYLSDDDKRTVLEKLRGLGVATYTYQDEPSCEATNNQPKETDTPNPSLERSGGCQKRLGIIAEEAPLEVLSADKKGVDLYKLATFILAGVQELDKRLSGLEFRVTKIEELVAATATSSPDRTNWTDMSYWTNTLAQLGLTLREGLAEFKNLVVAALTVGTTERPTGITLYDKATGAPYCLEIENGQPKSTAGACGAASTSSGPTQSTQSTQSNGSNGADTEPPVITVNGNNPAEIAVGAVYADLGAAVTDNVNSNLGVKARVDNNNDNHNDNSENWVEVGGIHLNTASSTTYTIYYRATDQAGNVGTATRTVVVGDGGEPISPISPISPTPAVAAEPAPAESSQPSPEASAG